MLSCYVYSTWTKENNTNAGSVRESHLIIFSLAIFFSFFFFCAPRKNIREGLFGCIATEC